MAAALAVAGTMGVSAPQASAQNLSSQANLEQLGQLSSAFLNAIPQVPGTPAAAATSTRTVTVRGVERTYNLVVPANYNPGKLYPVIIGYGGWQHSAEQARSYEKLENAANGRAIIVYAQAIDNAWGGAPYAKASLGSDIEYTRAIINNVASTHNIDRSRVYATGLSNGGGMALALGCHAPELVAGVAGVAGAYYNPTVSNCAGGRVKTLIMHADNDDIVSYDGGTRHGAPYRSARAVFHTMGTKNDCNMNDIARREAGNTTIFDARGCKAPTQIQKIRGGGHTWFTNPDATRETVNFLLG